MPYESKDARLIFTTPAGQSFSAWNKAWTETYAKERANG